jgi:rhodanese-related sulfurtransferase
MDYKEIWIDIRDEHELLDTRIVAPNEETLIINIPSRNIFANVNWIKATATKGTKITLICRSANRSQTVKTLYFAQDDNIVSLDGGIKNPLVKLEHHGGGLGLQQIIQLVFATILTGIFVGSFFMEVKQLRFFIVGIIFFIIYQVLSKSCLMGKYVPLASIHKIKIE